MSMDLDSWQERLESQFEDVTLAKLERPHEPVTFALEHGLNHDERAQLSESIHESLRQKKIRQQHYLCWVAYAAEFGYRFSGNEYWYSFTKETPGWDNRKRWFIKSCFKKFKEQYNGAEPKGPWAAHFNIICWPITHAILPADLQRQLAEILFRIRHTVVRDDISSPRQLGQIIAANSQGAISRFTELASEHELIGQIASALLLDDQSGEWIEASALQRITRDLSVEEQARSWLHDARRHVSHRAQVTGLKGSEATQRRSAASPRPRIRPKLTLRPEKDGAWRLVVEAPNFTPLVRHYSDVQPILQRAMVSLGGSERKYSGRALLHGSLTVPLAAWPIPTAPLIAVHPSHPDLDALLAHETAMPAGPWLFRLNQDGIATEVRSKRISANAEYLLITDTEQQFPLGERAEMSCAGAWAWLFSVSSLDDTAQVLHEWGLSPARAISVRPSGLPSVTWDREGAAEWLSTNQPVVSLSANFAIARFEVQMDVGTEVLNVTATPTGNSLAYVVLPKLPAGTYLLHVTAYPVDPNTRTEEGDLEVSIRDPSPGSDRAVALVVSQEPANATLEQLLEGEVSFHIHGPQTRSVSVSLRFLKNDRIRPIAARTIQSLALPVSPESFTHRLEGVLKKDDKLLLACIEADACELIIKCAGLGTSTHRFERPFTALRWGLLATRDGYSMTLFEDVENPEEIEITRYEFSTPLRARLLTARDLAKAAAGKALPGMYVARSDHDISSSIVPLRTLDELRGVQPKFFRPERDLASVKRYLDTICLWHQVESRGNLFGRYAWRRSIRALVQQVVGLICGTPWYKAERRFDGGNRDLAALGRRIPYRDRGVGWAERLIDAIPEASKSTLEERIKLLASITGYSEDLCEFALRLTTEPATLYRGNLLTDPNIRTVMHRSELVRAARFLVLGMSAMGGAAGRDDVEQHEGL